MSLPRPHLPADLASSDNPLEVLYGFDAVVVLSTAPQHDSLQ